MAKRVWRRRRRCIMSFLADCAGIGVDVPVEREKIPARVLILKWGGAGIRKKLLRKRLNLVVMPLLILLLAALCVYLRPGDNAMRGAALLAFADKEGSPCMWERSKCWRL